MLRITDARTGEPAELRRALTRVHAHVRRSDTSALRVLLVADVLARVLELGGIPVLPVADPPAGLRDRANALGIRPTEAAVAGGGQVLHVVGPDEPPPGAEGATADGIRVEVARASGPTEVEAEPGGPGSPGASSASSASALRLALLSRARHTPADLDDTDLAGAGRTLDRWRGTVAAWATRPSRPVPEHVRQALRAAWENDLDVPAVLDVLREVEVADDLPDGARFETYAYADRLLGLELTRDIGAPV
ncbi:hypothetical protein SGFS_094980 [Streptomyces graminofaciens]|uniref:Cysteinyl-tRNA synthetase n=1 Tax=Streptomyces graminofaciens TaxID=68212 RepID=A0ABM7FNH9_9ACTN|nr:hypothetical protein [Streptomyces graminofaciens]BBC38204.1 hypothetical protein SGFS_094980 [Streptomyces graminofaciens]